jgi:hypothetical protein
MDVLVAPLEDLLKVLDTGIQSFRAANPDTLTPLLNNWQHGFVCSQALLDPKIVLAESSKAYVAKGVCVQDMPLFAPFLQPADVCGSAHEDATTGMREDVWSIYNFEDLLYSTGCIVAPYKEVLQKATGSY